MGELDEVPEPEVIGNGKKAKSVVQHHLPAFDVSPSERGVLTSSEDIASTWFQPHDSKRASLHSLFLALTVHSFIEGMSMGAQEHMSSFIGISVAVAAHKALAGFALGSNMVAGCRHKAMYVGVTIFASCSPLGMLIGTEAAEVLSATGVGLLLALASGTFLYVALPDLLLPALHSHGCATIYLNTFIGMLGMSMRYRSSHHESLFLRCRRVSALGSQREPVQGCPICDIDETPPICCGSVGGIDAPVSPRG